jgi:hypothetical protein
MNVPPPPPPPPSYGYEARGAAPRPPKKNPLVIIFAILGVLALCCGAPIGALFFYGKKAMSGFMNMGGCMVNVSIMESALEKYVEKNGKYPNAATWQKEISEYVKPPKDKDAEKFFTFWQPDGVWSCKEGSQETGFSFNDEFSGKKPEDVKEKDTAILVFETNKAGYSQHGAYAALPHNQSPKVMGEFMDERRGWIVITANHKLGFVDKSGKISRDKNGTEFKFDPSDFEDNAKTESKEPGPARGPDEDSQ